VLKLKLNHRTQQPHRNNLKLTITRKYENKIISTGNYSKVALTGKRLNNKFISFIVELPRHMSGGPLLRKFGNPSS